MQIIFGESAHNVPDNYTVLELDTFQLPPDGTKITSYCVVEHIPLDEWPQVNTNKERHQNLLHAYRNQQWNECELLINLLIGRWSKELDSFYTILQQRIETLKTQDLPEDWDGSVDKTIIESPVVLT